MSTDIDFERAAQKPHTDNRIRAIIAINIFALCEALFGAIFKFAERAGVSVGEFAIARTALMFVMV
jgi:hypothetical protein